MTAETISKLLNLFVTIRKTNYWFFTGCKLNRKYNIYLTNSNRLNYWQFLESRFYFCRNWKNTQGNGLRSRAADSRSRKSGLVMYIR